MSIMLGCDPEVFLYDTNTRKYVSAYGLFPGTKESPFKVPNGAIQVDGNALEFNIDPAATEQEFVDNINSVMATLSHMVKCVCETFEVRFEPVATFDEMDFKHLPIEAKVLGCDPDFNPSSGNTLYSPDIVHIPIRTGSGHIHIGWTYGDPFDEKNFLKRMEVAAKVTPHLLERAKEWENESSVERRKYYGHSGACRPKPYGVELRALDNLWLKSEDTIRTVYRTTMNAFLSSGFTEDVA